ncbi:MAG TPA: ATP-binding protein [Mycobacteriales bacterium]|nr:ATP-binding protein [Mycobacteriales bacterium]
MRGLRSLRARLVFALVGLLAAACVIIGAGTEIALHAFLIERLDAQLAAAGQRSQTASEHPDGGTGGGGAGAGRGHRDAPGFLLTPGQAAGTLGALVTNGSIGQGAVLDADGRSTALPAGLDAVLAALPLDGQPHTRALADLGDYRLLAAPASGGVLVTGLPMAGVRATLVRLAGLLAVVSGAALVLAALGGAGILRLALRPLSRLAGTADRVVGLPLDRGEVALAVRVPPTDADPGTEVGRVGHALNSMLGHVDAALRARQDSESRVRQFVADASHELRTPLAVIRGYAELARHPQGDPEAGARRAIAGVEAAAGRMGTLVDDLLLLARLDSGRPLAADPVDLSRLVVDSVADAHAAGPGHRWRLSLPVEPIEVTGDELRLHQVLGNLLANARAHTPPGTTVTVGLATAGTDTLLTVTDDGPGIPAQLLPVVFERFARGDRSRSRAAGSTGLGLSIVAAVVQAHRGTVGVDSRPGHTAVTVRLPAGRARRPPPVDQTRPSRR